MNSLLKYDCRRLIFIILLVFSSPMLAASNELNLYLWFGEVPDSVIQQFQKETGIKVNYSTYNSNETLYTKLSAAGNPGYDVIEPSGYYVDRMAREQLLEVIDKKKLSNWIHLEPAFLNPTYDPNSDHSVPYLWGSTGIFVNRHLVQHSVTSWEDLWAPAFKNQLLILNDAREVFPMALKTLGFSANDDNEAHIKAAYEKLKKLLPNIKLFNSDSAIPIMVDEEVAIGTVWSGDFRSVTLENSNLEFIYPKEGFVMWMDAFAIPKDAPHPENAYRFLNFMLRPDIAAEATLQFGYAVANRTARLRLPKALQNNPILYPNAEVLKRGEFQTDISNKSLRLYEHYWELLKMG